MRVAGQPESVWTRRRRRWLDAAQAPPLLAAAAAVLLVGFADGWQLAVLTGAAAGAVAATRIRFSGRASLGLLMVVLLLALGGWGPGAAQRSAPPAHRSGPHADSHPHPQTQRHDHRQVKRS